MTVDQLADSILLFGTNSVSYNAGIIDDKAYRACTAALTRDIQKYANTQRLEELKMLKKIVDSEGRIWVETLDLMIDAREKMEGRL